MTAVQKKAIEEAAQTAVFDGVVKPKPAKIEAPKNEPEPAQEEKE